MAPVGRREDHQAMNQPRSLRLLLATAATATLTATLLITPAALAKGGGATGGGGGQVTAASLQADWPAAVPVPAGTIQGTSGVAPSETVALIAEASYPDVAGSVRALYTSRGFTQAADGTLVFSTPSYRVTVVGSARDHSPTRTDVVVWLQTL
jgi:hypothetical protein